MSWWEALILGLIQGLTEFLPVSSSGHLELAKAIFGDSSTPEESLIFTVILHFATALATVVVFWKDIQELVVGILKFKWNDELKFAILIVISMIPAAVIGIAFEEEIEALFGGQVLLVASMLIVTALLLVVADRAKNTNKPVSYLSAVIIGIAQAIAILPGISRSGATISTSVLLGIDRSKAARFSFLMVVPLIFGKIAKDLLDGDLLAGGIDYTNLSIGFVAAFVSGIFACKLMINLVKRAQLWYFSAYCIIVVIIAFTLWFL